MTSSQYIAKGVTLLEMMLVLGIMTSLLLLGINSFQVYDNTQQAQALQYNVNQLMQAAKLYIQANCATGTLSPKPPNASGFSYPPTMLTFPLSISSLTSLGYLNNWDPVNPLIDPSGGESGYIVQLNPYIVNTASINDCEVINPAGNAGAACTSFPSSVLPTTQAQAVYWIIQVAVKINNPSQNINAYSALLNADCISGEKNIVDTTNNNRIVAAPCSTPVATKNYLVWTRLPSFVTVQRGSLSDASTKTLINQFNLQYTHDQNYELNLNRTEPVYYVDSSNKLNVGYYTTPVYYLCGG